MYPGTFHAGLLEVRRVSCSANISNPFVSMKARISTSLRSTVCTFIVPTPHICRFGVKRPLCIFLLLTSPSISTLNFSFAPINLNAFTNLGSVTKGPSTLNTSQRSFFRSFFTFTSPLPSSGTAAIAFANSSCTIFLV